MLRKIIAEITVDEDKISDNSDTLEYLEREFGQLDESGIFLSEYRILDDDDKEDEAAIECAEKIFNGLGVTVDKEKRLCYLFADGHPTSAEYTLIIDEPNEKAFELIKLGEYDGEEIFFRCVESSLPISSRNIVPDNEIGFVFTDGEGQLMGTHINNGFLVASISNDSNLPGIYTTFYPDDDNCEDTLPEIFMGFKNSKLCCEIWADKDNENYTDTISFK